MPFNKLTSQTKKFSKLRIKQLWSECRIEAAHFSSIKHGKIIIQSGKRKTLKDCIRRFAKARGLLWALNYPPKKSKGKPKTTLEFRYMYRLAFPSIKYFFHKYKGRVTRTSR